MLGAEDYYHLCIFLLMCFFYPSSVRWCILEKPVWCRSGRRLLSPEYKVRTHKLAYTHTYTDTHSHLKQLYLKCRHLSKGADNIPAPHEKAIEATPSSPPCSAFSHNADVIYINDKHGGWLDWQRNPLAVSLGRKREKGYYGSCFISVSLLGHLWR